MSAVSETDIKDPCVNRVVLAAEFTPGAYLASDIDNFAKTFAPDLYGKRPKLVSIDGGRFSFLLIAVFFVHHSL
jgi:hypothetical protein